MFAAVSVVAGSAVVSTKRIALVTGANKGIGKEIARLLGALPDHAVVLGCRDKQLGMAAAAELQAEGCDAAYCWVDLADPSSFESARAFVEREYGRLDALVNNAAVLLQRPNPNPNPNPSSNPNPNPKPNPNPNPKPNPNPDPDH